MKDIFKKNNGVSFDDFLDRNQFLLILDKNMLHNKRFERTTAEKIFSVIDWNKEGRVSVYVIYFIFFLLQSGVLQLLYSNHGRVKAKC